MEDAGDNPKTGGTVPTYNNQGPGSDGDIMPIRITTLAMQAISVTGMEDGNGYVAVQIELTRDQINDLADDIRRSAEGMPEDAEAATVTIYGVHQATGQQRYEWDGDELGWRASEPEPGPASPQRILVPQDPRSN